MKLKNITPVCLLLIGTLCLPQPSIAEEKIKVLPIIQSSKGLSGKNFNYLEGKPELRLLKVKIPVGLKTPIHTHPSPAEEKIEVIPIIQSSKGLSGKNFNYLESK